MTDRNVVVQTGSVKITGVLFLSHASRFNDAAHVLFSKAPKTQGIDPVPYFLACQALELHLKSFLWLKEGWSVDKIITDYRHNLGKLWTHSKQRDLHSYVAITTTREQAVNAVATLYQKRKLNYLSLGIVGTEYDAIKNNRKHLRSLIMMNNRLETQLRPAILAAA
jgi:hypothetical protein